MVRVKLSLKSFKSCCRRMVYVDLLRSLSGICLIGYSSEDGGKTEAFWMMTDHLLAVICYSWYSISPVLCWFA